MARSKAAEANRLYWESDVSVAEIAQRLELSRRALYAAIQPLPADRNCERCGGKMTYENRSARASDQAVCLACEEPEQVDAAVPQGPPAAENAMARLAGAALAGMALGALVTMVLVPRR
jgi:hypothetical protein